MIWEGMRKRIEEIDVMRKNGRVCYEKKRLDRRVWERREKKFRVCEDRERLEEKYDKMK